MEKKTSQPQNQTRQFNLKRLGKIPFILLLVLLIIFTTLAAAFISPSCSRSYSGPVDSITVGYSPYLETAFYWIAQD